MSFQTAREQVNAAIEETIRQKLESFRPNYVPSQRFLIISSLNVASIAFFALCAAFHENFRTGYIFGTIVILILAIINFILMKRYSIAEMTETLLEISTISRAYSSSLEHSKNHVMSKSQAENQDVINCGHSHVSIIAVFRDGHWQRIPSLLLVEGDIISLMAGDTTPGSCYELISDRACTVFNSEIYSQNAHSLKKCGWRRGKHLEKGTKVLLRAERKKYSSNNDTSPTDYSTDFDAHDEKMNTRDPEVRPPTYQNETRPEKQESDKHKQSRAINSQSIELLTLSGDMRCFLMAETPMVNYCKEIFGETTASNCRDSFVRTLFVYVLDEGFGLMKVVLLIFAIAVIIRMAMVPESNHTQFPIVSRYVFPLLSCDADCVFTIVYYPPFFRSHIFTTGADLCRSTYNC